MERQHSARVASRSFVGGREFARSSRSCPMNIQELPISNVPLFATIPPDELAQLATELQQATYPAGSILMREGERGDGVYIVLSGMFEIIKELGTTDER